MIRESRGCGLLLVALGVVAPAAAEPPHLLAPAERTFTTSDADPGFTLEAPAGAAVTVTIFRSADPIVYLLRQDELLAEGEPNGVLDRALARAAGEGNRKILDSAGPGESFVLVARRTATAPPGDGWATFDVSLGTSDPGLYVCRIEGPGFRGFVHLLITDVAVVVRRAADATLVFAADRTTGRPRSGVEVVCHGSGRVVARGVTGEDGLLRLDSFLCRNLLVAGSAGAHIAIGEEFDASDSAPADAAENADAVDRLHLSVARDHAVEGETLRGALRLPRPGMTAVVALEADGSIVETRVVAFEETSGTVDFGVPEGCRTARLVAFAVSANDLESASASIAVFPRRRTAESLPPAGALQPCARAESLF